MELDSYRSNRTQTLNVIKPSIQAMASGHLETNSSPIRRRSNNFFLENLDVSTICFIGLLITYFCFFMLIIMLLNLRIVYSSPPLKVPSINDTEFHLQ